MKKTITIALAVLSTVCLTGFSQTIVDLGRDWDVTNAVMVPATSGVTLDGLGYVDKDKNAVINVYPKTENAITLTCAGDAMFKLWRGELYDASTTNYPYLMLSTYTTTEYIDLTLTDDSKHKTITSLKINGVSATASRSAAVFLYSDVTPFDASRIIKFDHQPFTFPQAQNGEEAVTLNVPEGCKSIRITRRTYLKETADNPTIYEYDETGTRYDGTGGNFRIAYIALTLDAPTAPLDNEGTATNPILTGGWDAEGFDALLLDYSTLTTIDFTSVTGLSDNLPTMTDLNPNCLIYVSTESNITGTNVISFDADNVGTAGDITLQDGSDFWNTKAFDATGIVSYTRTFGATNGWSSICLPFAADFSGYEVKSLQSGDDDSATFTDSEAIEANIPYLIEMVANAGEKTFTGAAVDGKVAISASANMQPVTKNGWAFTGNYSTIAVGSATGLYLLNTSSVGFGLGKDDSYVPAFRAYLEDVSGGRSANQLSLVIDGVTGILMINTDSTQEVSVYSLDGCLVKKVTLNAGENPTTGLAKGLYIINNQKVVVR